MGLFDALFGKKVACPPLDPLSAAAASIGARGRALELFAQKIQARLELVPDGDVVYVYLGQPPGQFGMAWFENDREVSLKSLQEDQGLSQGRIQILSEKLGAAYTKSAGAVRYAATLAGKEVLVTPSATLAAALRQAIDEAVT